MSLYPLQNMPKYVTVSNTWATKDTVASYLTKYTLCTVVVATIWIFINSSIIFIIESLKTWSPYMNSNQNHVYLCQHQNLAPSCPSSTTKPSLVIISVSSISSEIFIDQEQTPCSPIRGGRMEQFLELCLTFSKIQVQNITIQPAVHNSQVVKDRSITLPQLVGQLVK